MPKRNTTTEILDSLTPADRDAMALKKAALATIPDPEWRARIPFADVYSDRVLNVRDDASYAFSVNKGLFESLRVDGLQKRGDPMSFVVDSLGRYKILVGNLRHTCMAEIRRIEIDRRLSASEPADPDTLPFAFIFGLVYSGLTIGQEKHLVSDHIGRKDLNEFERCREIGEFLESNGYTDDQGRVHFGMDKNKLRRYRMRYAMPTVMVEYRKEKAGKDSTESYIAVGQKALEGLYSAYTIDRKAGNGFREEGPAFRLAWDKVRADPTVFNPGGPKAKGPESVGRDDLLNMATGSVAGFGDGFEIVAIADALRYASGETVNLNTVRQTAKDSADALRADVSRFATDRETLTLTVETISAENATLRETIATLTDENATLRDTLAKRNGQKAKA